ncbi:hypothetical protein PRUPE_3G196700 [Prunus persica]|uniref:RIN4 pathogenic type III effector avirulence factor Avr cleavage site domain-containing protein n=1 Tax=Prunus persica TaxID=3760 RepID=A0A251Q2U0_PRUPE|nr:uncharacterized protein LOC18782507 isoform X1 [Prunus persica]ONI18098.1 hypothetical protein PRUPE_3G196700 [Prunus persica]
MKSIYSPPPDALNSLHIHLVSNFEQKLLMYEYDVSKWCLWFSEKGVPLPKFGEWDVNDPASAEGFTVIFNKARTEKKEGGRPDSPSKDDHAFKHGAVLGKPPAKWFCCLCAES